MRNKKGMISVLSLGLVAVIATAGTLAYFTYREFKENVFTVGAGVYLSLTESNWDVDNAELVPNVEIEKNPVVAIAKEGTVEGRPSYVRLRVDLLAGEGGSEYVNEQTDVLMEGAEASYVWNWINEWNEGQFELDAVAHTDANDLTKGTQFFYYYDDSNADILEYGTNVNALFSGLTPDNAANLKAVTDKYGSFNIKVTAEAIQADYFKDDDGADTSKDSKVARREAFAEFYSHIEKTPSPIMTPKAFL